jgi:hypothetical protein
MASLMMASRSAMGECQRLEELPDHIPEAMLRLNVDRKVRTHHRTFSVTACSIQPFLSDHTSIQGTHLPDLSQNASGIQIAALKQQGVTLYGKDSPHNPSRKAFPLGEYRLAVLYLLAYLLRHYTWDCRLLYWLTEPAQHRQPLQDL